MEAVGKTEARDEAEERILFPEVVWHVFRGTEIPLLPLPIFWAKHFDRALAREQGAIEAARVVLRFVEAQDLWDEKLVLVKDAIDLVKAQLAVNAAHNQEAVKIVEGAQTRTDVKISQAAFLFSAARLLGVSFRELVREHTLAQLVVFARGIEDNEKSQKSQKNAPMNENRKKLPKNWKGMSEEEYEEHMGFLTRAPGR